MEDLTNVIEQIKSRINITDVVSRYVSLKKVGKNYSGLCPFHAEKTPSFFVNPVLNIFKCFGCGVGGDVIKFLMEIEKLTFKEAVQKLAKEAGIELGPEFSKASAAAKQAKKIKKVLGVYTKVYQKLLNSPTGTQARDYVFNKRKIRKSAAQAFKIGYAPVNKDFVQQIAKRLGLSEKILEKTGLLTDDGISRFRHRVMFPVMDASGDVVGFTARTLYTYDRVPKYINTPETPVFKKRFLLYGLFQAKQSIIKQDMVILTEGAFDVISSYQAGVENIVAPMGTSLTETQLIVLKRFTKNITFAYDNDSAGKKALHRAVILALSQDMRPYVLDFSDTTKDIDEYIRAYGDKKWQELVKTNTKEFFEYAFEQAKDMQSQHYTEFEDYLEELLYIISFAAPLRRQILVKELANRLQLDVKILESKVEDYAKDKNKQLLYISSGGQQGARAGAQGAGSQSTEFAGHSADAGEGVDDEFALQTIAHNLSAHITKLIVHHPALAFIDGFAKDYKRFILIPEHVAIIRHILEFFKQELKQLPKDKLNYAKQGVLNLQQVFMESMVDNYAKYMQNVSKNAVFEADYIDLAASTYDIPVVLDKKDIEDFKQAFARLKKVVLKLKIRQLLEEIDRLEQESAQATQEQLKSLELQLKDLQKELQELEEQESV